jgi:S1-C subfamily serine protease
LVLGDIITAVNGKNVRNSSDLYRMLDKARVSDALCCSVLCCAVVCCV